MTHRRNNTFRFRLLCKCATMLVAMTAQGCGGDPSVEANAANKDEGPRAPGVDDAASEPARVKVEPAVSAIFDGRLSLTGVAKPLHEAVVSAEIPGRVVRRSCKVGSRVRAGDVLYRLDDLSVRLELRRASETLAARRTDRDFMVLELQRAERLVNENAISEQALSKSRYDLDRASHLVDTAKTAVALARKKLGDTAIEAPFAGTVATCRVELGDYVGPGTPAARIVDLSKVLVEVGLPSTAAAGINPGDTAHASFDALPDGATEAVLEERSPSPDPASGTYPYRFAVDNEDGRVLEGMTAHMSFSRAPRKVTAVPAQAVFRRDGTPAVFVLSDEGEGARAVERTVRPGVSEHGMVEIADGLSLGELVVVEGMFALESGGRVIAEQGAAVRP